MTRASFAPALLKLAWPVALSRLGIMGMGVTDVIVVGQLAPHDLAHQALGWAPTGVALVGGIGLLTGVQVLAARALGAGDPAHAGAAWRRGVVVALIAGMLFGALLFAAAEPLLRFFGISPALAAGAAAVTAVLALSIPFHLLYTTHAYFLEAIQRPMASTVAMWGANILNLVLNLWLVPEHGAVGSAFATVISRLALAVALAVWIWMLRDADRLGVRARSDAPSYMALLQIGAAAAVSQVAEAGAFSAMTVIAGRIGEQEVATYQILLQLMAIVFMIAMGLSTATAVLVSDAVGRRAPMDAVRAGWTGLFLCFGAMLIMAVVLLVGAPWIARLFTADLALAAMISALMPLAALTLTPDGGQVVAAQALRARGDNWFPTFSHVLAYVAIMPPLALYLAEQHGMGVAGLMYSICISSVVSVSVLAARFWALGQRDVRVATAAAE